MADPRVPAPPGAVPHRHPAPGRPIRHPACVPGFPESGLAPLEPVLARYEFRVTPYYAGLVDWSDPDDPLRRIVLPDPGELVGDLDLDPSREAANTKIRGLQHKYGPTALLLVTDVCAAYCRFCFRKRFTLAHAGTGTRSGAGAARETTLDVRAAAAYLAARPEITNVLLSGGDPLMLAPARLAAILDRIRRIPHLRTIRIGSKVPAFDPERLTPELVGVLAAAGGRTARVYVATHFSHPRELTPTALAGIDRLFSAGIVLYNQTPVLRGVNDTLDDLAALLQRLSDAGVPPYYLFQCRPVAGNERFAISLQEGIALVDGVRRRLSGLAKRFRYVASHATGKIEIVGCGERRIILRYHQARDSRDDGRTFSVPAERPVYWLDEAVAALAPRVDGPAPRRPETARAAQGGWPGPGNLRH